MQVGDPFEEKRLIEACLELLDAGLAVGVQDLGAAGLSCAASETAAKAGAGMDVDVARVAEREPGMNPVEVMTSESQERMLAIVEPAKLDAVLALARRWEIRATVVGRVTDTARFRVFDGLFDAVGVPGENPAPPIGDDAPRVVVRSRRRSPTFRSGASATARCTTGPVARPPAQDALQAADPAPRAARQVPAPAPTSRGELLALLATPTIADKTWVSRQYDHQLFLNTVVGPGGDAAVLRVKGTTKALALVDRRQGPLLPPRSAHRRPARGARSGAQRRVRRCATARARELPQLRQSRAPRGDVAVLRSRRGHERSVRGARHPGRSAATSASTTSRAATTSIPRRSSACSA